METGVEGFQGFLPSFKSCFAPRCARLWFVVGLSCGGALCGWASPRVPVPPRPESSLAKWRFDLTDSSGTLRPTPLSQLNIALLDSWSGYALGMAGAERRLLQYPLVQGNGRTNLNLQTGSIRCWLQVNWTSQALGGSGPGTAARVIETNGIYDGTNVNRSGIQWLKLHLSPDASALTLSDHGRIFDSLHETNAWWYYYASLAVNCPGDMVAGFSGSSATDYVGAFHTWRLSSGLALDLPRLFQAGTTAYSGEWGHYSATTLDPTDDWSFWTVQAYQTTAGLYNSPGWATVVAKIRPNP